MTQPESSAPAPAFNLDPNGPFGAMAATFKADPAPLLGMLRENQPLLELPGGGGFALFRYADVNRLIKSVPAGMRTREGVPLLALSDEPPPLDPNSFLLLQDGAEHTRLRKLVSHAFTPRAIDALKPHIDAVAEHCVDAILERGELEVMRDLAQPVPSTVICHMLGVPQPDRESFTRLTAEGTHALATIFEPAAAETAGPALLELADYFRRLIEERRKNLGDDLLSALIRAEEDGDRLSAEELLVHAVGLLAAGFETTIGLIGLGTRQLLRHPGELARLREDPARIATTVDEALRFDPPIIATLRVLHEDVDFHGKTLRKDTRVVGFLAAANRDPRVFVQPDRFDITRCGEPHLSFGGGAHFCLGSHLAKLEAQAAIGTLVRRVPHLELVDEPLEWGPSLFRVPSRIRVEIG